MSEWINRIFIKSDEIRKTDSVVPELFYVDNSSPLPRVPKWDLVQLYSTVDKSWVLQEVFGAIIRESMRPGWAVTPKFAVKCELCGAEYDVEMEECEYCHSKKLRKADERGRRIVQGIMNEPNSRRDSFRRIMYSIMKHDLIADNWYLSIEYAPERVNGSPESEYRLIPSEIAVQDPRFVRPIMDEFGRLGNSKQWFCPIHWHYTAKPDTSPNPGSCPICNLEMQETVYIQVVNGTITARWGINQMVQGSSHQLLPYVFGEPRSRSLWHIIHGLIYMDEWFVDTISEGRTQKIVVFPGYDQAQVSTLVQGIRADQQKKQMLDSRTGEYRSKKGMRVVMIGTDQNVQVHDIGIKPSDIEMLDYYRMAIQAVAGTYGVQAIFISFVEKGRAGTTPAMQIEVQNRTTANIHRTIEDVLNNHLFPIFGVYEWGITFGEIEKRDERRDADIEQTKASTALTWKNAGYKTWIDEYGNLQKSKHPVLDVEAKRPGGPSPQKQKESQASGMEIEGTSTEREPHGPRPPTEQDEEREK